MTKKKKRQSRRSAAASAAVVAPPSRRKPVPSLQKRRTRKRVIAREGAYTVQELYHLWYENGPVSRAVLTRKWYDCWMVFKAYEEKDEESKQTNGLQERFVALLPLSKWAESSEADKLSRSLGRMSAELQQWRSFVGGMITELNLYVIAHDDTAPLYHSGRPSFAWSQLYQKFVGAFFSEFDREHWDAAAENV